MRPVVNCCVARPTSGPPVIESATSCSVRPSTAGKSAAAGSAAAPHLLAQAALARGRCCRPSPPLVVPAPAAGEQDGSRDDRHDGDAGDASGMSLEARAAPPSRASPPRGGADADRRRLASALGLILAFMVAEVVAGILAGSLALLSDAAHMLTDAGSLALALVAARLAARPPSGRFTFGLGRAEILSAQLNGATLLVLAGVIAIEAVRRLFAPPRGGGRHRARRRPARRGASTSRPPGSWPAPSAARSTSRARAPTCWPTSTRRWARRRRARSILLTGFREADAIAALLVVGADAALRLEPAARRRPRSCSRARPRACAREEVGRALAGAPGIVEVHDLHVWEVTSGFPALAAHVLVRPGDDCHGRRRELEALLRRALRDRPHDAAGRPRARGELLDIEDRR